MGICFDRPEMSPGLAKLKNDPAKYNIALAIIRAGKATLEKSPRADMPEFAPCQKDREREAKYARQREIEMHQRDAIRTGARFRDPNTTFLAAPTSRLQPCLTSFGIPQALI
jgi:hypothetical protein